jgi:hypothetical protein
MVILPQSRGSRSFELDIQCIFSASNVNVYANICVKHSPGTTGYACLLKPKPYGTWM